MWPIVLTFQAFVFSMWFWKTLITKSEKRTVASFMFCIYYGCFPFKDYLHNETKKSFLINNNVMILSTVIRNGKTSFCFLWLSCQTVIGCCFLFFIASFHMSSLSDARYNFIAFFIQRRRFRCSTCEPMSDLSKQQYYHHIR